MLVFVGRRLLWLIPTLLGITFLTSQILYLVPGDPAQVLLGEMATQAQIQQLHRELHLNRGPLVRFGTYVWNAVHGDLGRSYRTDRPVTTEIGDAFPETLELALTAWVLASVLGTVIGVFAASRPNTLLDGVLTTLSVIGLSVPVFWLGILLIYLFANLLHLFPTGGTGGIRHLVLPAITLASPSLGIVARFVRDGMIEAMQEDYVRTARAKGVRPWAVLFKHGLRNAILPAITMMGIQMGQLLSGSVLTETVFAWPGVGRLLVNAIGYRDLLLIQGIVLVLATVFVLVNLAVDIAYAIVNPRVQYR
ncbi:MAG: ABC transporter permease [Deinococcales bacterium]